MAGLATNFYAVVGVAPGVCVQASPTIKTFISQISKKSPMLLVVVFQIVHKSFYNVAPAISQQFEAILKLCKAFLFHRCISSYLPTYSLSLDGVTFLLYSILFR